MGEAYEAADESGRRLALKVLNRSLDNPEDKERFLREGRLAASVSHPNSVYVYETREIEGIPAIVMELVDGGTIRDRIARDGPAPPAEAVGAMLQLIAGLGAVAERGVLHRDIKPANCFIDRTGTVKIGDYGLSLPTSSADMTRLTAQGIFIGTPAYASPEQVRCSDVDVRSDIYSAGATMYYMLTGRAPFVRASPMQVLAAVLQENPASPDKIAPQVPRGVAEVVMRCLRKDPRDRFASYAQLHDALLPFGTRTPDPARWIARCRAALI
jgi:serine/threonine protein kinase